MISVLRVHRKWFFANLENLQREQLHQYPLQFALQQPVSDLFLIQETTR